MNVVLRNSIILIVCLCLSDLAFAQCTNSFAYGTASAPTGSTVTTISTCTFQEEYNTVTGVVAGETYESTYDLGGCITVHSGTPGGPVVAFGSSPLSWTATVGGTYYFHYTLNCTSCTQATNCGTSTIECTSCSTIGCSVVAPVPNDPCYQQVIANDPYCCNTAWDFVCQDDYDLCNGGTGCSVVAPVPNDACYQQVIANDAFCCNTAWDTYCQADYDACNGGGGGGCTTQSTNDFCNDPAILTQGAGTWSSTTSSTYTADLPGNINSVFCGSIENNSWYMFTAQSTTESFPITSVFNCNNGWGIQAQVYSVTTDVNGCCSNFTSMSNCYNPGTTTLGTVTATGLTVGANYYLMVDGNAGDDCDFTVSGWTATGILPVELIDLHGIAMRAENSIGWTTKTEIDNDRFNILKSYDGINFVKIGEVAGAGNSSFARDYHFSDREIRYGKSYYRLEQVDYDGETELSEIIVLDRETNDNGLLSVRPNPAKDDLLVEINPVIGTNAASLQIIDTRGQLMRNILIDFDQYTLMQIDLRDLEAGVYMLRYVDKNGQVQTRRFVKSSN